MLQSLPTYETALEQAKRHVVEFQRIIASLEVIGARMDYLEAAASAATARALLVTCRHSLSLAVDHLDRLSHSK